jgi:hypothetical protein
MNGQVRLEPGATPREAAGAVLGGLTVAHDAPDFKLT